MNFETLVAKNARLRNIPKNIVFSQKTFGEDITCCQWALYRGSTAIVQAASAGLRPIYYQLPSEMTVDPLYELNDYRIKVKTVTEFQCIMNQYQNGSVGYSTMDMKAAKIYCDEFYLPFNCHVLIDAIK